MTSPVILSESPSDSNGGAKREDGMEGTERERREAGLGMGSGVLYTRVHRWCAERRHAVAPGVFIKKDV